MLPGRTVKSGEEVTALRNEAAPDGTVFTLVRCADGKEGFINTEYLQDEAVDIADPPAKDAGRPARHKRGGQPAAHREGVEDAAKQLAAAKIEAPPAAAEPLI